MSKTLEKAIADARKQPPGVQEALGAMLESAIADPVFDARISQAEAEWRDRETMQGYAEALRGEGYSIEEMRAFMAEKIKRRQSISED
jgi:hypothetical protein